MARDIITAAMSSERIQRQIDRLAVLLIVHEIESAYWREWKLLRLSGGRPFLRPAARSAARSYARRSAAHP